MSTDYFKMMLRLRPAKELLGRIHKTVSDPVVVDLGCGDGHAIPHLRQHWPTAKLVCVDMDKTSLHLAMGNCIDSNVSFIHSRIEDWVPTERPNVLYANSVMHLIKDHGSLMAKLVDMLPPGGVLAVQMPCIADTPLLDILNDSVKEIGCASLPYQMPVQHPSYYYEILNKPVSSFETWTTAHHHYIPPENIVPLIRSSGTGGTIWAAYVASVGKNKEPEFTRTVIEKCKEAYPLIPSTNECLFSLERFYLVLTKEGHGPTMGVVRHA
eukprot:TRINITY_DN10652_c0_g1_i1.p1 TRINITY_DN10652_c0_g1~~TRINITY_DN10652_c0_g1_i1.p1  ORF type:complete len:268 (+),score=44.32 TRINITY_DN10652_c0_g1_i1:67-870(+)